MGRSTDRQPGILAFSMIRQLKFYRGGYEYVVNEATKAALIAGGVGVTESNFTAV